MFESTTPSNMVMSRPDSQDSPPFLEFLNKLASLRGSFLIDEPPENVMDELEPQLAGRLAQGDESAFRRLYDAYADSLHHYLTIRLQSRDDADDVLQETFVRLARARRRLGRAKNLRAYVFTVARNEASRAAQRRCRDRARQTSLTAEELFTDAVSDDCRIRETARLVAAALAGLKPELREVVELKTYAGLTLAEIATVTGKPQGTVATRYRTALNRMRELLAREMR